MTTETHLVSFLSYSDRDTEVVPSGGRLRNMPPKNGRGSNEETYSNRHDAVSRAEALIAANAVERAFVYEADARYVLGRKLVWSSLEE